MKTKKIWILACAMLVAGEYTGQLIVTYTDKDSKVTIDEEGHSSIEAYRETLDNMHFDVSDYKMRHVFLQDFPVSLIARVVDADMVLSQALASAAPVAVTASYDFGYDTDYSHINWAFTPNVMPLSLHYGGEDHHIRIEFNNNTPPWFSASTQPMTTTCTSPSGCPAKAFFGFGSMPKEIGKMTLFPED